MKFTKLFILICFALVLAGCGAQTTGKDITIENRFEFKNIYGPVTISPNLATKSGDLEQTTKNPTEVTTPIDMVLTPAQMLADAGQALANAKLLEKTAEIKALTPALPVQTEEPQVDNDNTPAEVTDPTWQHSKVYNMQEISHDRPFYRLGIPGEQFGSSILFTDDKGNTFFVPDTSQDTGDKAEQYFFNGKGQVPTFDGNASMFWYSTGSHSITAHFNGEGK